MKKFGLVEIFCVIALVVLAGYAYAQVTLTFSIDLPHTQGLTVQTFSVNALNESEWTSVGNALNFADATLNTTYGVYTSNHYYASEIAATGYGADWGVTLTSTSTGEAGTAITVAVTNQILDAQLKAYGNTTWDGYQGSPFIGTGNVVKYTLAGVNNQEFRVEDGWLRTYIGLYGGSNATNMTTYIPGAAPLTLASSTDAMTASLTITMLP